MSNAMLLVSTTNSPYPMVWPSLALQWIEEDCREIDHNQSIKKALHHV